MGEGFVILSMKLDLQCDNQYNNCCILYKSCLIFSLSLNDKALCCNTEGENDAYKHKAFKSTFYKTASLQEFQKSHAFIIAGP